MVIGLSVGLTAVAFTWLVKSETSPLYQYFFDQRGIAEFWVKVNFLALVIAVITGITSRAFMYLIIFLQWLSLAWFANWVIRKFVVDKTP